MVSAAVSSYPERGWLEHYCALTGGFKESSSLACLRGAFHLSCLGKLLNWLKANCMSLTLQKLGKEGGDDTWKNRSLVIILQVRIKTYSLLWYLVLDTRSALNLLDTFSLTGLIKNSDKQKSPRLFFHSTGWTLTSHWNSQIYFCQQYL